MERRILTGASPRRGSPNTRGRRDADGGTLSRMPGRTEGAYSSHPVSPSRGYAGSRQSGSSVLTARADPVLPHRRLLRIASRSGGAIGAASPRRVRRGELPRYDIQRYYDIQRRYDIQLHIARSMYRVRCSPSVSGSSLSFWTSVSPPSSVSSDPACTSSAVFESGPSVSSASPRSSSPVSPSASSSPSSRSLSFARIVVSPPSSM